MLNMKEALMSRFEIDDEAAVDKFISELSFNGEPTTEVSLSELMARATALADSRGDKGAKDALEHIKKRLYELIMLHIDNVCVQDGFQQVRDVRRGFNAKTRELTGLCWSVMRMLSTPDRASSRSFGNFGF